MARGRGKRVVVPATRYALAFSVRNSPGDASSRSVVTIRSHPPIDDRNRIASALVVAFGDRPGPGRNVGDGAVRHIGVDERGTTARGLARRAVRL